jgi:valyl-tRNA synthetase
MSNILDWCISRQLWWGHRIPAFYCDDCAHVTVTRDDSPAQCSGCGSAKIRQDEDVLDTWFSSGLWPFSTLGWPDKTPALERFYPASDLETGYDILFFWVARMMMMGIHFMGEPPFKRVLLHGMVVDETGEKMSKVKGNVIDPLDLIHGATFDEVVEKALPGAPKDEAMRKFKKAYPSAANMGAAFLAYGADALRYTLATYSPQAKRIPLSPKKLEGYRNFCNKVWNATRYALTYLDGATVTTAAPAATLLPNRWILSRLSAAATLAQTGIDGFRLDDASLGLYHFFWGELCDWYLEISKPIFAAGGKDAEETRDVLAYVLESSLRLLHPFIPFITEELWHKVPRPEEHPVTMGPRAAPNPGVPSGPPISLALASYPDAAVARRDEAAERDMTILQAIISAARSVRSEHEVKPRDEVPLTLRTSDASLRAVLEREIRAIRTLVKTAGDPVIEERGKARPLGSVMSIAAETEVLVGLKGLVEADKEGARIDREIKKVDKDIGVLEKKLSQPTFADKAPPEVVAESRALLEELKRKRISLEEARGLAGELAE